MNTLNETAQSEDLGVLLFAFDNTQVDYISLAMECAKRVIKHWGLPVTLVSDVNSKPMMFDKLVYVPKDKLKENPKVYLDYEANLQFWNSNRCQALELTPYRRTILLDVDLLVQTDAIPRVWDGQGIKLTNSAYSVFGWQELSTDMKFLSRQSGLPMSWATVVCFDKEDPQAIEFFKHWVTSLARYKTYSHLYKFAEQPVRNDFAVTLALEKMRTSYSDQRFELPYQIPSLMPLSRLTSIEDDCLVVEHPEGARTAVYSDLHVMNKKSILECLHHLTLKETESTESTVTES
jgi:hypothetical protein